MFALARVIVVLMLSNYALAGYFNESEGPNKQKKRRERRGEEEYDDSDRGPYAGRASVGAEKQESGAYRRARIAEMNKMRSRNSDEMTSPEYTQQILADELIEETHTSEENLDGYMKDEEINKIWAEHMHDFVAEDMINVLVEKKSTEALMETINH